MTNIKHHAKVHRLLGQAYKICIKWNKGLAFCLKLDFSAPITFAIGTKSYQLAAYRPQGQRLAQTDHDWVTL